MGGGVQTSLGVHIFVFTRCDQLKRHQNVCSYIELQLQSCYVHKKWSINLEKASSAEIALRKLFYAVCFL